MGKPMVFPWFFGTLYHVGGIFRRFHGIKQFVGPKHRGPKERAECLSAEKIVRDGR